MAKALNRLLAVALGFCLVGTVNAQEVANPKCGPRADLVKILTRQHQEVPVAIGMINDQLIMETYASVEGTWTMFLTNADGNSCLIADGDNWFFDLRAFDKALKKGERGA